MQPSRILVNDADYAVIGVKRDAIEPWEDGLRTDHASGSYEWWYLDAHLDDGSTLVIVFFTKPIDGASGPLRPFIRVDLDRPDGSKVTRTREFEPSMFSASKSTCDVRIGQSRFEGDLHTYRVHLDFPEVSGDLTLTGEVPAWRPGAGAITFGAKDEKYFAWLPSVPHGTLVGTLRLGDLALDVKGAGYHDHNWGNAPLTELIHDWYWGRARVGEYSVIASFITADERYQGNHFPLLFVAKGDTLLVGDSPRVTFQSSNVSVDEQTGKPVASTLQWEWADGAKRVRVSMQRKRDLLHFALAEQLPPFMRFLAGLSGFDGAYHRFTGEVTLEVFEGEQRVDEQRNTAAVWELMYLGHAPAK